MRKLALASLVLLVSLVLGVSLAAGATHKGKTCSKKDDAGNWEVVLGTRKTDKAAKSIVTRASSKGLTAKTERDGCAKRWEAEITVSTKTAADTMKAQAVKDGFTRASIEKS